MGIQEINIITQECIKTYLEQIQMRLALFIFGKKQRLINLGLLWWILRMSYQSSLLLNMTKLKSIVRFDQQVNTHVDVQLINLF
jgi:hypothetical protein